MNGFVIEVRLSADERLLRALEALGRRSSAQGLVDPRPAALPQAAEAGTAPEAAGRPAADRETIRREAIEEARKKGAHFGTAALFAELKGEKVSAGALKLFAVRNGIPTLRTFSPEKLAQLRAAAERMREKRWGRAGRASGTRAPGVEAERPSAPAPVEAGTAPEAAGRPAADRETIRREAIEEARKKGGHFGTAALFAELKGKKVSAPALKMFAVRNGIPTLRTFSPEKLAQLRAAAERMREKRWGRAGRASGTRAPGVEAERPSAPAPVEADYETALRWGASHGLGGERLDLDQVNAKRESLGLAPFSLQARR